MARTSKIALMTATALAVLAVLTGSLLASVDARAAATSRGPQSTYAATATSGTQSDGIVADNGGQNGRGTWRDNDGPGQRMDQIAGDGDGGWDVSDILQWVAIAVLAGFAVALLIWRPWRPDREQAAVQPANPGAPYDHMAPSQGAALAQPAMAPEAGTATATAVAEDAAAAQQGQDVAEQPTHVAAEANDEAEATTTPVSTIERPATPPTA